MKKAASLLLAVFMVLSCTAAAFAETAMPDLSKYSDDELVSLFKSVCTEIAQREIPQKTITDAVKSAKQQFQDYFENFDFGKWFSGSKPKDTIRRVEPDSSVTSGMKNALRSAESYLSFSSFSYTGLIDQLKYEGYTQEEATYAADNCGADWNEQAVASAKSYLSLMAFSRSGLIEQLEYEGFTHDQAVYGVDKAY